MGDIHGCALHNPSWLLCWGNRNYAQDGQGLATGSSNLVPTTASAVRLDPGVVISDIALGLYHTVLLLTDGSVLTFGFNDNGQCGQNIATSPVLYPGRFLLPSGVKGVYMAARYSTCVIGDDGAVYCAGRNDLGQLGIGSTVNPIRSPVKFQLPAGEVAVSMDTGHYHTCTVTASGKVYCSGENGQGQVSLLRTFVYVLMSIFVYPP